jgi:ABC-type uncharacterized transport system involved in gliding motility auxiliary subunit
MKLEFLKAKQTKYTAYVVLYTAIVLAVIGVANFLANRHSKSWDSTANKRYSLSDQTLKITTNLKNDVKIIHFNNASRFRDARELLDKYDRASTKVSVDYIDPDRQPDVAMNAGYTQGASVLVRVGGKREEAKSLSSPARSFAP